MNLRRTARLVATLSFLGLIAATLWLLSLDTLAQANWVYPATALVVFTGVVVVVYAVRRYQRLDELTQRIHLIALAVAFVGTLLVVFVWTVLAFFGLVDDFQFMGFLTRPGPSGSLGFYVIGTMVALYLVGWVWGRSLYR
jgi:hypothetical protein